ncbi:conserved Plasmodium protein, unknown function [Plasmodium ovale]|uniref:Uncharacterized protein n=1 Tax=Plasmodium ovale TaxID=36330 RepID=A0A1D3TKF6_PLAOA|nr:conserved Plasmodium protein, unknown function [Plasmodium ovale]
MSQLKMKKKKKSVDRKVWNDALDHFEELSNKNRYSLTKDTIHGRLRPEPEIIENVLEELENKIRHYFSLYQIEKEKRTSSEKNSYYLQKEVYSAYAILDKNKIYTKKLEDKLNSIKENQSSLIDTVRRIDLLYIQLDTLVQSFAGVCTQVATETSENSTSVNKKRNTLKMLLDYIYPCRTLDPRINSLYGILYYQSVGLLKDGKFMSPPIPPVPPVVPSEGDGWLPPSRYHHNHHGNHQEKDDHNISLTTENSFSDLVRTYKQMSNNTDSYEVFFTKYVEEEQNKLEKNENIRSVITGSGSNSSNKSNGIIPHDLLGFDVQVSKVEIKYSKENPRIICVIRYDSESTISAIQNSRRVTKARDLSGLTNTGHCIFQVDNTVNLDILPQKIPGEIPSFMIDIHDVSGKVLIGTSRCSFISEKTLTKDSPWDIYSRLNKSKPEVIGKVYVTVQPFPSNSILPAETFKNVKKYTFPSHSSGQTTPISYLTKGSNKYGSNNDTKVEHIGKMTFQKSALLSKVISEQDSNQQIGGGKNGLLQQRGKKVTFKPYTSKSDSPGPGGEGGASPGKNALNKNDNGGKSATEKEGGNGANIQKGIGTTMSIKNRIKNLTMKFEHNKTSTNAEEDPLKKLADGKANQVEESAEEAKKVEKKKSMEKKESTKESSKESKKVSGFKMGDSKGDVLKKSLVPIVKDGVLKVKLPSMGKTSVTKKIESVGKASNAEHIEKTSEADEGDDKTISAQADMIDVNVAEVKDSIGSNKMKPFLKIKIEPKKDNLKKLFNKIGIKTLGTKDPENSLNSNMGSINENKSEKMKKEETSPILERKRSNKDTPKSLEEDRMGEVTTEGEAATMGEAKEPSGGVHGIEKKKTIKTKMLSFFKIKQNKSVAPKKEAIKNANPTGASKILKKPIPKDTISSPVESQSSTDGPELKNILENAKKKAVFIDKNKITIKLTKKVEIKKEIKKFIPKLKNVE